MRPNGKSSGSLKPSKRSQTLRKQNGALFDSGRPPVPASISKPKPLLKLGQDPRLVQPSSSKVKPTHPAVVCAFYPRHHDRLQADSIRTQRGEKETVKKPGFFSRLFGTNKSSKPKYPEEPKLPKSPKPLKKTASTPHIAPSNITKPNTAAVMSPVAKPSNVAVPSSTPGRLQSKPVKSQQPVRPSVEAPRHRDRARLARPSRPEYEVRGKKTLACVSSS